MLSAETNRKSASITSLRLKDVEALAEDCAPARRAKVARQLALDINGERLSGREWEIAFDIVRSMSVDTSAVVRQAVATSLKSSPHLPRDIAVALAHDETQIALPIIEKSPALSDSDLVALILAGDGVRQITIAKRPEVSRDVAGALLDSGNPAAVTVLLNNPGAALDEEMLHRALDVYAGYETVKAAMVHRRDLPASVCEPLTALVSDRLKVALASRQPLPAEIADDMLIDARAFGVKRTQQETHALIEQLHAGGRLTASLTLRALCLGDIRFVEEAMAELGGVSVEKAAMLLHEGGALGLNALYAKCEFPETLYLAFRIALDMFVEEDADGVDETFEGRVIEKILAAYHDVEAADLAFLSSKLGRLNAA